MSDISLSASMRSNLLSLQNTSKLMDMTSDRLSTGKKVNSALDNPSAYFTAQGLTNRAGDLSSLLDSMTQAINTLKAAEQGIDSLTSLVSQAKAVADEAYEAAAAAQSKATLSVAAAVVASGGQAIIGATTISVTTSNGTKSLAVTTANTIQDVMDWLNDDVVGVSVEFNAAGDWIVTGEEGFTIDGTEASIAAGVNAGHYGGSTVTLDIKMDSALINLTAGDTITFGATTIAPPAAAATNATTGANIFNALKAGLNANYEVGTDSDGYITVSFNAATTATVLALNTGTSAAASVYFGDSITAGAAGVFSTGGTVDNSSLVTQFNDLMTQMDQMIVDTSYKGINLLNGSDLTVNFNEDRTSSLTIAGVTFDASGLGFTTASGWNTTSSIQTNIDQTSDATDTLRAQSASFGRNASVVQTRQDFTGNMINTLKSGADDLTLADMNEEGANMLALQTRQQLATSTLSMASQASQAVLSLFR